VKWKENGERDYDRTDKQNGRLKNMGVERDGNGVDVQTFVRYCRRISAERCNSS
jgi:hypothetical protein